MRRLRTCSKVDTRWIILLILFLCPVLHTGTAEATTVVVVRTPSEVYIGADSRVGDVRDETFSSTACKIRQVGDLFFAFSGLPRIPGVDSGLMDIIEEAVSYGGSIADMVEEFDDIIVDAWTDGLKTLKEERPDFYRKEVKGRNVLQIAFAGIQKRKPVFFMRHLKAVDKGGYPGIAIFKKSCPGDCRHGKVIAYLGQTGALDSHMSDSGEVWKDGYVEGIRELITLQMEAEPEQVGPPIDILLIKRQGARWIQVKSECPGVD